MTYEDAPPPTAALDAFLAAWAGRDPAAFTTCCAPDLHYEDPFCGEGLSGPEAMGAHAGRLWRGAPDVTLAPTGPALHDRGHLCVPLVLQGRDTGGLDDHPPSRRRLVLPVVLFAQLDPPGERVWRARAFCDRYDAALQLGRVPAPGTFGERALSALQGFGLRPRS